MSDLFRPQGLRPLTQQTTAQPFPRPGCRPPKPSSSQPLLSLSQLWAPTALKLLGQPHPGAGLAQSTSITPRPSLPDGSSLTLGCTGVTQGFC